MVCTRYLYTCLQVSSQNVHMYVCALYVNIYAWTYIICMCFIGTRKCCDKPTRLDILNYTSCIYIYIYIYSSVRITCACRSRYVCTCMCVCKCTCMYKCQYHLLLIEIHLPVVNKARCTELHIKPIPGSHGCFMFINSNCSRRRRWLCTIQTTRSPICL